MASFGRVAQRAASIARRTLPFVAALAFAGTAVAVAPAPAQAAGPKVVIVVGPSGSSETATNISRAKVYASQARNYGASVTTVFSPYATWARVRAVSQGANVFIYLGHGNGWPSPYAPFQTKTKDGLGLNPYVGASSGTTKYIGEYYIRNQIRFAPGAVVLLNHLCYASGNAEPGMAEPSWSTARQRVDNYAAGFLGAGASAVIADGHTSLKYELSYLFGRSRSIVSSWKNDPDANGHVRAFASQRTRGFTTYLDPNGSYSGFYRSLTTKSTVYTGGIRNLALRAVADTAVTLRTSPTTTSTSKGVVGAGGTTWVIGKLSPDSAGRTWAKVITSTGIQAWVAGWVEDFRGTARPTVDLRVRTRATTSSGTVTILPAGTRVTVLGSVRDRSNRSWLQIRTGSGKTGYMAGWLSRP